MALQKSILKLQGTLDELTFYFLNGKPVVRRKKFIPKDNYLKQKAYSLFRQNAKEFGGSALIGKAFRTSLGGALKTYKGETLHPSVVKLVRAVIHLGPGHRGQRSFLVLPNAFSFKGFEFAAAQTFTSVCSALFSFQVNTERNTAELTIPGFENAAFINAPEGATHFRIVNAVTVLSDYSYNDEIKKYAPVLPELNGLSSVVYSPFISLKSAVVQDILITASLPGSPVISAQAGLITCIGIEFYQEVNGAFSLMKKGNAMQIADVF